MALLVHNCPRCGAKQITFDVRAQVWRCQTFGWKNHYEIFCVCRKCHAPTIFLVSDKEVGPSRKFAEHEDGLVKYAKALNDFFHVERFISLRDQITRKPPEHLPQDIRDAFVEGAASLSISCHNAAGTMFRLAVDLVTRPLLPDPADSAKRQPNAKQRRDLGLRLAWLFDNGFLPEALRELAKCIREDANDGAHAGTLKEADAEDIADFTTTLLERLITEPAKLKLAEQRRSERRQEKKE